MIGVKGNKAIGNSVYDKRGLEESRSTSNLLCYGLMYITIGREWEDLIWILYFKWIFNGPLKDIVLIIKTS